MCVVYVDVDRACVVVFDADLSALCEFCFGVVDGVCGGEVITCI